MGKKQEATQACQFQHASRSVLRFEPFQLETLNTSTVFLIVHCLGSSLVFLRWGLDNTYSKIARDYFGIETEGWITRLCLVGSSQSVGSNTVQMDCESRLEFGGVNRKVSQVQKSSVQLG